MWGKNKYLVCQYASVFAWSYFSMALQMVHFPSFYYWDTATENTS